MKGRLFTGHPAAVPTVLLALIMAMLLLAGCGRSEKKQKSAEETTRIEDMNPENIDRITMEGIVSDILSRMTLEEKVGQLFIVSTDSLDFDAETEKTDQMIERLEKYKPGGVIFFSFNIKDRKQLTKFITDMQATASIPLFIAVDEEGGNVSRVASNDKMGLEKIASMSEIGQTGDSREAYRVGETIGSGIHELGFNLDFAPVADVRTNETNTEIGDRSFGSDPALVSEMVSMEVKGLQSQGVSATLKHFPGQGDTGEDTHKGYVDLDTNIDRLRKVEFKPFEAGIKAGADFVMVSHVSVKAVTGQDVPASLSKLMVSDILRDELSFDGIIITDALNMKGITKFYDSLQASQMAVEAGNDMILMPDDFVTSCEGLTELVEEGTVSESVIDRAVSRILEVKIRRGILPLTSDMVRSSGGEE